ARVRGLGDQVLRDDGVPGALGHQDGRRAAVLAADPADPVGLHPVAHRAAADHHAAAGDVVDLAAAHRVVLAGAAELHGDRAQPGESAALHGDPGGVLDEHVAGHGLLIAGDRDVRPLEHVDPDQRTAVV